jgi:hypothetical protein
MLNTFCIPVSHTDISTCTLDSIMLQTNSLTGGYIYIYITWAISSSRKLQLPPIGTTRVAISLLKAQTQTYKEYIRKIIQFSHRCEYTAIRISCTWSQRKREQAQSTAILLCETRRSNQSRRCGEGAVLCHYHTKL